MWAKHSTAATLIVGPILDSAGAEYASAVIGDLSISKNGGTLTALAAAATLTHIANGQYTLVMTTGNLDTLGRLQITCNKSTYQMPPVGLNIVPADRYDSLVLGTDRFDANVTHVGDTSQTAGDIYASQVAIAGYIDTEVGAIKTKTDQLTFTTANKVDSTAALDSAVTAQITGIKAKTDNLPSDPADQSLIIDATNAVMTRLGAPVGASISADIAGISVGAGGGDWSDAEKAQIRYRLGLDGTATAPDDPDGEPIVVEPGSGNFTTGYVTCFDQDGQMLPNCKLYQRMIEVPASDVGYAYDSSQTSVTSNTVGVAQFPRLVKGGTYLFFRGLEREGTVVTIPTSAGSTYALPSVIGR